MILTVTLNTAVDKTYTVENFRIDRVHRPSSWRVAPGGKGVNVARVYRELGGQAMATGFVGGYNGDFIMEGLRAEGLLYDFVRTKDETRVCIKVVDPVQKTQTELNEVGPDVSEDEVQRLRLKFESLVRDAEYAVLCGSLPPGVPDTIYKELIEIARHYGVRCVLDASGEALAAGLEVIPYMAKPNVHELSGVAGRQIGTVEEAAEEACRYIEAGIEIMLVTFGRDGALAATKGGIWWARSPEIEFVSAVGSGDSLAAAFLYSLSTGKSIPDALKLGTGAGAANASTHGAGFCKRDEILRLADNTEVTSLEFGAD